MLGPRPFLEKPQRTTKDSIKDNVKITRNLSVDNQYASARQFESVQMPFNGTLWVKVRDVSPDESFTIFTVINSSITSNSSVTAITDTDIGVRPTSITKKVGRATFSFSPTIIPEGIIIKVNVN